MLIRFTLEIVVDIEDDAVEVCKQDIRTEINHCRKVLEGRINQLAPCKVDDWDIHYQERN